MPGLTTLMMTASPSMGRGAMDLADGRRAERDLVDGQRTWPSSGRPRSLVDQLAEHGVGHRREAVEQVLQLLR